MGVAAGDDVSEGPDRGDHGASREHVDMEYLTRHALPMLETPTEAIEHVLTAWELHPGGVEGWFMDNGGSAEAVQALRSRLDTTD